MAVKNVAILGGGAGALATGADLTRRGFSVNLFELPQLRDGIKEVIEKGGIEVKGPALKEGFVKFNRVTVDIREALEGADIVLLVVPGFGVETFAELSGPFLKEGQMVVVMMAGTLGALRFDRKVKEIAKGKKIRVAETSTLPYATRRIGPSTINLLLLTKGFFFAAFPGDETAEMIAVFRELYPSTTQAANILETTLNNGNPVIHPAGSLMNVGRIEFSKGEFYLYREGISEGVARVIEAVDRERLALCRKMGFKEVPTTERIVKYGYTQPAASLYEELHNSSIYPVAKGPLNIHDRYISEDIPYGLVLWASIARNIGVATPLIEALIEVGSALCEKDFRKEGLSAEKVGLGGLNASALNKYLMTGKK